MRRSRPLVERFWEKVNKEGPVMRPELGPCWIWTAARTGGGYGYIGDGGGRAGRSLRANRVSWELQHGALAASVDVLHRCDNPACVRPEHLFLGDARANAADMVAKGRGSTVVLRGESHGGARLNGEQVVRIRQRCAAGEHHALVANDFGVSVHAVRKISQRATWRHI